MKKVFAENANYTNPGYKYYAHNDNKQFDDCLVFRMTFSYFFVLLYVLRNNTEIKSSISLMRSLEKISHDIIQREIVSEKPKIG